MSAPFNHDPTTTQQPGNGSPTKAILPSRRQPDLGKNGPCCPPSRPSQAAGSSTLHCEQLVLPKESEPTLAPRPRPVNSKPAHGLLSPCGEPRGVWGGIRHPLLRWPLARSRARRPNGCPSAPLLAARPAKPRCRSLKGGIKSPGRASSTEAQSTLLAARSTLAAPLCQPGLISPDMWGCHGVGALAL